MSLQFNTGNSYWPIFMGVASMSLFINILNYLNFKNNYMFMTSFLVLMWTIYMWYKDLFRESHYKGSFNIYLQICFKMGMMFFILSEFMFFFSFFWSYFHFMFMYQGEFSFYWPPIMVDKINYMALPLFNTFLLLTSGLTLTLAHNNMMLLKYFYSCYYLMITIMLGMSFTLCQLWEFYMLPYSMNTASYGSIFFMGTGFHGSHVILGSLMLIISLSLFFKKLVLSNNSLFEMSAWYWHFVDVIWLFLFMEFYWWMNFIYGTPMLICN